jgi:hypothetical protein
LTLTTATFATATHSSPYLAVASTSHRSLLQQLGSTTATTSLALLAHTLVHAQLLGCLLLLLLLLTTLLAREVVLHLCMWPQMCSQISMAPQQMYRGSDSHPWA